MPIARVPLSPGIVKDDPSLTAERFYADGDRVRFRNGRPEQIGGWAKLIPDQLEGKARGILQHVTVAGARYVVIGTTDKLYAVDSATAHDISPVGLGEAGDSSTFSGGWGSGAWGAGPWGGTESGAPTIARPRTWALATFGDFVLASPSTGGLYVWEADTAEDAEFVDEAPSRIDYLFVTPERFAVALGTLSSNGVYNSMLARWASQATFEEWSPTTTNTARELPLSGGSRLVAGGAAKLVNLIWSDKALFVMRYLNDTALVYGIDPIGQDCGLIGPNAFTIVDGAAFWISPSRKFYLWDGGSPRPIPCPVERTVFEEMNPTQTDLIFCGLNSQFTEVIWFYPRAGEQEASRYVTYNYTERTWSIGSLARTAWTDRLLFDGPLAVGDDGYVYVHEVGIDADGEAMGAFVKTALFDLEDGDRVANVLMVIPDVVVRGVLDVKIETRRYAQAPVEQTRSLTMTSATKFLSTKVQGRAMEITYSTDQPGAWFRAGDLRLDIRPGARR